MAQLSDDCFAFGGTLLSVDAALALIAERVVPVVGEEIVPLREALGRILAHDLVAERDVPPHSHRCGARCRRNRQACLPTYFPAARYNCSPPMPARTRWNRAVGR